MPAVASIDGVISPLAAAAVPLTDRGLLFGDHFASFDERLHRYLVGRKPRS